MFTGNSSASGCSQKHFQPHSTAQLLPASLGLRSHATSLSQGPESLGIPKISCFIHRSGEKVFMMMVSAAHLLFQPLLTVLYWKIFPCDWEICFQHALSTFSRWFSMHLSVKWGIKDLLYLMDALTRPILQALIHRPVVAEWLMTTLLRVWSLLSGLAAATLHSAQLTSLLITL